MFLKQNILCVPLIFHKTGGEKHVKCFVLPTSEKDSLFVEFDKKRYFLVTHLLQRSQVMADLDQEEKFYFTRFPLAQSSKNGWLIMYIVSIKWLIVVKPFKLIYLCMITRRLQDIVTGPDYFAWGSSCFTDQVCSMRTHCISLNGEHESIKNGIYVICLILMP